MRGVLSENLVCQCASSRSRQAKTLSPPFLRGKTHHSIRVADRFSTARVRYSMDFQRCSRTAASIYSRAALELICSAAARTQHARSRRGVARGASRPPNPWRRREIRSVDEFRRLVQTSPRVFLVEFFSGMCGYCQEFEPTWLELAKTTTRLEPARVNIDMPGGLAVAELVGVINEGIPAVVLFNQRRTDAHQTLMAGELEEPKLLRRVYKATKGKYLSTDSEGFFLRSSS